MPTTIHAVKVEGGRAALLCGAEPRGNEGYVRASIFLSYRLGGFPVPPGHILCPGCTRHPPISTL